MALKSSEVIRYALYNPLSGIGLALPMSYLTVFQTEGLGWSAALATTVLIVPRIIDFLFGVSCGAIMSKVNLKGGRYRSWFLLLRWVLFAGIVMQFLNTKALPLPLQVLIVFVGYVFLHGSMNFVFTGQMGIMFTMGGGSMDDRTRLSIRGNQFNSAGSILSSALMIPAMIGMTKLLYPENTNPNWFGPNTFTIMAIITAGIFFIGCTSIASAAKSYDQQSGPAGGPAMKLGDIIKGVATNDQLLIYSLVSLLTSIGMWAILPLGIFYYMYVLGNMTLMPIAMTISTLFGFAAALVGPQIGKKVGMKRSMVIGMIIGLIGSFVTANFAGITTPVVLFAGAANEIAVPKGWLINVGMALVTMLAMQMYAGFAMQFTVNAGEYGYWKTGKDNRTAAMGLGTIPIKIAIIVGGAIGGYALAGIGYQPGMGMPGGPAFPPNFSVNFMRIMGYVPGAFNVVALLLFAFGYKITDANAKMYAAENMKRDMEARAASGYAASEGPAS